MTDNIAEFPYPQEMTTPTDALRQALDRGLTAVLILGYTPEGALYVRSSGEVTRREALWMLELGRLNALGVGPYGEEDDE